MLWDAEVDRKVRILVARGRKIDAIRLLKREAGLGSLQARRIVVELADDVGQPSMDQACETTALKGSDSIPPVPEEILAEASADNVSAADNWLEEQFEPTTSVEGRTAVADVKFDDSSVPDEVGPEEVSPTTGEPAAAAVESLSNKNVTVAGQSPIPIMPAKNRRPARVLAMTLLLGFALVVTYILSIGPVLKWVPEVPLNVYQPVAWLAQIPSCQIALANWCEMWGVSRPISTALLQKGNSPTTTSVLEIARADSGGFSGARTSQVTGAPPVVSGASGTPNHFSGESPDPSRPAAQLAADSSGVEGIVSPPPVGPTITEKSAQTPAESTAVTDPSGDATSDLPANVANEPTWGAVRVWTDDRDRTVAARLIEVGDGFVLLSRPPGGRRYSIPLNRLSPTDLDFIRQVQSLRSP